MRKRVAILCALSSGWLAACGSPAPSPDEAGPAPSELVVTMAAACTGCHASPGGAIANLSGYSESELLDRLTRYSTDPEGTTVMHRLARGYSETELAQLAAYLGGEKQ